MIIHSLDKTNVSFQCFHYFRMEVGELTFPSPLEKEPHNKHLQPRHRNHHQTLNNAEIENPSLGAAHSAKVAVLARTEVFLVSRNGRQEVRYLCDGFFDGGGLFGVCALSGGEFGFLFVFDLFATVLASCAILHIFFFFLGGRGMYSNLEID